MSITIRVISDLHIDINSRDGVLPHFGFEDNINDTDLVLIAGDISGHYKTTALFLEKLADKLKGDTQIVVVGGNHLGYEHLCSKPYENTKEHSNLVLRTQFDGSPIAFLEVDDIKYKDYTIVGCTLYSNFKYYNNQKHAQSIAERNINDFRYVLTMDYDNGCIRPVNTDDYIKWYNKSINYINDVLDRGDKTIVVTHFAPSEYSIGNKYVGSSLNPYYCTDLKNFIKSHNNLKLWVHGHVHDYFNYMLGNTRVVCSPYGYHGYEQPLVPEDYQGKILTLD